MVAGNPDAGAVSYQPGDVPGVCSASNRDGGVPGNWVVYEPGGGAGGAPPEDAGSLDGG